MPLALVLALAAAPQSGFDGAARPFLDAHCARCHGPVDTHGDLDLTPFASDADVAAARDDWDWLRERVTSGEMPPRGEPRPTASERAAFIAWLDGVLGDAPGEAADDGAPPPVRVVRRLTSRAYSNAVRDLFGVEFDAATFFPRDAVGHGFEGVGEAQVLSDGQVELYLEAAERIAARALPYDPPGPPPVVRVPADGLEGRGAARGGAFVATTNGVSGASVPLRRPGRYRVRAEVYAQQAGDGLARASLVLGGEESAPFDVAATREAPEVVEAELATGRADARVGVRFLNDYYRPASEGVTQEDRNLWIRWVEVEGPLDPTPTTPVRAWLEAETAGLRGRARLGSALALLGRRVWRRPLGADELARLEALSVVDAPAPLRLRTALVALLASPHFLFAIEGVDASGADGGAARPLTDHELATRLALFLWASVPDRELDALADAGLLSQPEILDGQVTRMLDDGRSRALADGFAIQWLHLGALEGWTVDEERFPGFDARLVASMQEETRRVFVRHVRTERPLDELLDGTRTVVDRRLARHYGVPFDGDGPAWQEVDVGATGRRGLLGHASVLTVTSEPTRTSPVRRGKWVLEVLLGSPPPPPPPGVDSLDAGAGADATLPLRERLALHRADPNCATCHARMDPLGFGLEEFDAVGRARAAADAFGQLPDGRAFSGAVELVALLRAEGVLARQVTERVLLYALGRPLGRADRPHVQAILDGFAGGPPTLRGILRAVALSRPFRSLDAGR